MSDFYDQLAPIYHLIYRDWDASMVRQGEQLSTLIESEWPGSNRILDVSCGIGTQAIALAGHGYSVTASDLSERAVDRARLEAARRGHTVPFSVCDMRCAFDHHGSGYDVVISADNSVPHLLSDDEILLAFKQMHACLRPDGGVLITVRDYQNEQRGSNIVKPYGLRVEGDKRYVPVQVWDFEGEHYNLAFFFVEEDLSTGRVQTHVMRSTYYAISTERLCELLRDASFDRVRRVDGAFFQPVLVGTKVAGRQLGARRWTPAPASR
jgi:SAM-dependent methyltransferase